MTKSAGCQSLASANVVINAYVTVGATLNSTNITCLVTGNDGKINITTPTGGSGTYKYSKDGGTNWQLSGNFTGLSAGTYNVKIRDQGNTSCVTTLNGALVISYTALSATVASTNVTCRTAGDGTITITAAGGSGAYQYSKDGGTNWLNNGGIFTGLIPATRDIQVRDKNNTTCVYDYGNVIITQPVALNATVNVTNIACYGGGNGAISITSPVGGGSGRYKYSINGGSTWSANNTFNSLLPNNYDVQIKDSINTSCITDLGNQTISQPSASLRSTVVSTNITCRGAVDGTITITPLGGYGTYQYSINGGSNWSNSAQFTGLAVSSHDIQIRDKANPSCVYDYGGAYGNVNITQPATLTASASATNVTCYGAGNGSLTVTSVSGGSGDINTVSTQEAGRQPVHLALWLLSIIPFK